MAKSFKKAEEVTVLGNDAESFFIIRSPVTARP